jgi:hypothetical protein
MRGRNTCPYYTWNVARDSKVICEGLILNSPLTLHNNNVSARNNQTQKTTLRYRVGDDDDPAIVEYPAEGLDNSQPDIPFDASQGSASDD